MEDNMKTYQLKIDDEFFRFLKVESAKVDKTMKDFIIEAVEMLVARNASNIEAEKKEYTE
jgi:hypothetical protein